MKILDSLRNVTLRPSRAHPGSRVWCHLVSSMASGKRFPYKSTNQWLAFFHLLLSCFVRDSRTAYHPRKDQARCDFDFLHCNLELSKFHGFPPCRGHREFLQIHEGLGDKIPAVFVEERDDLVKSRSAAAVEYCSEKDGYFWTSLAFGIRPVTTRFRIDVTVDVFTIIIVEFGVLTIIRIKHKIARFLGVG